MEDYELYKNHPEHKWWLSWTILVQTNWTHQKISNLHFPSACPFLIKQEITLYISFFFRLHQAVQFSVKSLNWTEVSLGLTIPPDIQQKVGVGGQLSIPKPWTAKIYYIRNYKELHGWTQHYPNAKATAVSHAQDLQLLSTLARVARCTRPVCGQIESQIMTFI